MNAEARLDSDQTILDARYQLVRLIDSGSAADVYEARHVTTSRRVAAKVFRATGHLSAEHLARFQREARVIGELRHPNIVQVLDAARLADGRPYIVMEYLEGTNLRELLNQPEHRDLGVIDLVTQTAAALDTVHELGIVHRDVKPENLFVCENGTVKLLDFGLVCPIRSSSHKRLTLEGMCNGTPEYMPPEVTGQNYATESFDIYALAVVAFELITGQLPFSDPNRLAVLVQKRDHAAPTLSAITGENYPEALERVLARGLERDPAARPRTAGRFARDLAAALMDHGESRPRRSLAPGKMNRWDVLGHSTSELRIATAPLRHESGQRMSTAAAESRSRRSAASDDDSKELTISQRRLSVWLPDGEEDDVCVAGLHRSQRTPRYLLQVGAIAALVGAGTVIQYSMTASSDEADPADSIETAAFLGDQSAVALAMPRAAEAPVGPHESREAARATQATDRATQATDRATQATDHIANLGGSELVVGSSTEPTGSGSDLASASASAPSPARDDESAADSRPPRASESSASRSQNPRRRRASEAWIRTEPRVSTTHFGASTSPTANPTAAENQHTFAGSTPEAQVGSGSAATAHPEVARAANSGPSNDSTQPPSSIAGRAERSLLDTDIVDAWRDHMEPQPSARVPAVPVAPAEPPDSAGAASGAEEQRNAERREARHQRSRERAAAASRSDEASRRESTTTRSASQPSSRTADGFLIDPGF